ncbi:hypothetical protein B0H14DRAFT_2602059 [Mycena olivaceomarginata]|nr:hypothetical protein B0H14DRAFT_2602059 [Mycena olivaceomarginata]
MYLPTEAEITGSNCSCIPSPSWVIAPHQEGKQHSHYVATSMYQLCRKLPKARTASAWSKYYKLHQFGRAVLVRGRMCGDIATKPKSCSFRGDNRKRGQRRGLPPVPTLRFSRERASEHIAFSIFLMGRDVTQDDIRFNTDGNLDEDQCVNLSLFPEKTATDANGEGRSRRSDEIPKIKSDHGDFRRYLGEGRRLLKKFEEDKLEPVPIPRDSMTVVRSVMDRDDPHSLLELENRRIMLGCYRLRRHCPRLKDRFHPFRPKVGKNLGLYDGPGRSPFQGFGD